jgi:hypothetical protein
VFTLAEKTGWPEQHILWELPLHRAIAYQHCALWQSGAWTVRPGLAPEAQYEALGNFEIDSSDE